MTPEEIFRTEMIKRLKISVSEKDFFERKISISPIAGQHDNLAGFAIAINGSPPKGILICFVNNARAWIGYLYSLRGIRFAFDTSAINPKKNNPFGKVVLDYLRSMGYVDESNEIIKTK